MADKEKDIKTNTQSEIIIYQTEDGNTKIDVKFEDETVWLTQAQLYELYQTSKSNISEHIKHIFEEGELDEVSVVRKFRTAGADGKKYNIIHYNLDMIISLGYRVRSLIATQFRRWATERLKEYMIKGFALDDERLKNLGGGNYWKELLDRIRDIRSSEKVMYRQVLDLYATSVDYDPKSSESVANILQTTGAKVLQGAGMISHAQAIKKAASEYKKYQVQNLSPVEEEYMESIKNLHSAAKKNAKK